MQKKVIVAAVAAAFALPISALAADSALMFYGKINVDVESVKSDKVANTAADASSLNRVQSNASRFGFNGTENLGGGLQTVYQFEAQLDTVNTSGTPFNGTRNSKVSLRASSHARPGHCATSSLATNAAGQTVLITNTSSQAM